MESVKKLRKEWKERGREEGGDEKGKEGVGERRIKGRDGRMNFFEKIKLKYNKFRIIVVKIRFYSFSVKYCWD